MEEVSVVFGQPNVRVTLARSCDGDSVTVRFRSRPFGEAVVRIFLMPDGGAARITRGELPGIEARALCDWLERELVEGSAIKAA
jgi:hypothetical protein